MSEDYEYGMSEDYEYGMSEDYKKGFNYEEDGADNSFYYQLSKVLLYVQEVMTHFK